MNDSVLLNTVSQAASSPDFVQRSDYDDFLSGAEIVMDDPGQSQVEGRHGKEVFIYWDSDSKYLDSTAKRSHIHDVTMLDGVSVSKDRITNLNTAEGDQIFIYDPFGFPGSEQGKDSTPSRPTGDSDPTSSPGSGSEQSRDSIPPFSQTSGDSDPRFQEIKQAFREFILSLPAGSRTRISQDGRIETNNSVVRATFNNLREQLDRVKDLDLRAAVGEESVRRDPFFRELHASQISLRRMSEFRVVDRASTAPIPVDIGQSDIVRANLISPNRQQSLGQTTAPLLRLSNLEASLGSSTLDQASLALAPGLENSLFAPQRPFAGF